MNTNSLQHDCPFCATETATRQVAEHGTVFAIRDRFPVTEGHLLLISIRHVPDWFDLSDRERRDAEELLLQLREQLCTEDPSITGFNIGINSGPSAGQTVMHAHIHIIPRRDGDCEDPRGGVRGVIAERQKY